MTNTRTHKPPFPPFSEKCSFCDGMGWMLIGETPGHLPEPEWCPLCDGVTSQLTEQGRALLSFLEMWQPTNEVVTDD